MSRKLLMHLLNNHLSAQAINPIKVLFTNEAILCPPRKQAFNYGPPQSISICPCHNQGEDILPGRRHWTDISKSKPKSNSRITAIHHTQPLALSINMYALMNLRRPDTKRHKNLTPNNIGLYDSRIIFINKGQEHRLKTSKEIIAKVIVL